MIFAQMDAGGTTNSTMQLDDARSRYDNSSMTSDDEEDKPEALPEVC